MSERPVVVLIGAPGAGKTRTGKRLARLLTVPFIDTDRRIVAAHGPIVTLFEEHGEPHFRMLERAQVSRALGEHAVVSLGGGAVLNPGTQSQLVGQSVVQLTVSSDAFAARMTAGKRPLVTSLESWQTLVAARQPVYDSLAQLTIDTSHRPLDGVAQQIVEWLENQ